MCDGFVGFVLPRDVKGKFLFASLQSDAGQAALEHFGLSKELTTIVLVENGDRYYAKSTAIGKIFRELSFPWWIVGALVLVMPWFLRDFGYSIVARLRYSLFGQKDKCVYHPGWVSRFVDGPCPAEFTSKTA